MHQEKLKALESRDKEDSLELKRKEAAWLRVQKRLFRLNRLRREEIEEAKDELESNEPTEEPTQLPEVDNLDVDLADIEQDEPQPQNLKMVPTNAVRCTTKEEEYQEEDLEPPDSAFQDAFPMQVEATPSPDESIQQPVLKKVCSADFDTLDMMASQSFRIRLLLQEECDEGEVPFDLGLDLGLCVPPEGGLDWELVVLNADRALSVSKAKLRCGDLILRIGSSRGLAAMLTTLAALECGSEEVRDGEVELEVIFRTTEEAEYVADKAVPISPADYVRQSTFGLVGAQVQAEPKEVYAESEDVASQVPSLPQSLDSSVSPKWLCPITFSQRMQQVISNLGTFDVLDLLRNLVPSVCSPRLTPTLQLEDSENGSETGKQHHKDVLQNDFITEEVDAMSKVLVSAAGECFLENSNTEDFDAPDASPALSAGARIWEALVDGATTHNADKAPNALFRRQARQLLWREALFTIGMAALSRRREELALLIGGWSSGNVKMDWQQQLEEIDEALGWASSQLDVAKAEALQLAQPEEERQKTPDLLVATSSRQAILMKPARQAVWELRQLRLESAATAKRRLAEVSWTQKLPPKPVVEGQLLSFQEWLASAPGCSTMAKLRGNIHQDCAGLQLRKPLRPQTSSMPPARTSRYPPRGRTFSRAA